MNFTVTATISPRLKSILGDLGENTRRALFSVGANALKIEVARHIRFAASHHHVTAGRLNARRTGHLQKGAARVTSHSTANGAEVIVPIAGISRAFHDLVITPKKAASLTIPISAVAYGHRVAELRRLGWSIFRLPKADLLMGSRDGQTEALYALKKRVVVPQDRSLLPTDETVAQTINIALATRIQQLLKAS